MSIKALRITSATYDIYRNMASLACLVILPPQRVYGSVMVVRSKTSSKKFETKDISRFSILSPCHFNQGFKFSGIQDQMMFSEVKINKKFLKDLKARKSKKK